MADARSELAAPSCVDIPYFGGVIERPRDYFVALGVEVQAYDLSSMTHERTKLDASGHVPQFCSAVHRARSNHHPMRVER